MHSDTLIDQTISRFPTYTRDGISIQPLEKGGSDRKYYRLQVVAESLILVKYGDQKEENKHYVSIAQFLDAAGVNVPRIYFHDESEGLIWMEDLGEVDLWEHRHEAWSKLSLLYRKTLDQAWLLHSKAHLAPSVSSIKMEKEFNAELYHWEQNYFFENCLARHFKIDQATLDRLRQNPALDAIAAELAALPRVLVHRDFQSQNVMIRKGDAYFIDFQGLRPGLAQYDLASLIYDPYVTLTSEQRGELLDYYIARQPGTDPAEFRCIFDLCAMQRLMQALGAYGFLGLVKERPQFLAHIPVALASLKEVISRISGLHHLRVLLDTLE